MKEENHPYRRPLPRRNNKGLLKRRPRTKKTRFWAPTTSEEESKNKNNKNTTTKNKKTPGQKQRQTLAMRMGFTRNAAANVDTAVDTEHHQEQQNEDGSSRDVAKVVSYKEPSLLTKMRRPSS